MLNQLARRFKLSWKKKYFQVQAPGCAASYAFVGLSRHALANLYPVLKQLGIPLKYIVTRQANFTDELSRYYPGAKVIQSLETVLQDSSIKAVFVCTDAEAHFDLLRQLLQAGKAVFIEKPPCQTLEQWQQLASASRGKICRLGLQRRYWPAFTRYRRLLASARYYNYRFKTGPYPFGDLLTELFIHPIDFAIQAFGPFDILSCTATGSDSSASLLLHVRHHSGVSGVWELSADGSWNEPVETMMVDTAREELWLRYPISLTGIRKPKRIFQWPVERVFSQETITKTYFSTGQFIVPAAENNTLIVQGFFSEILDFVTLVESGGTGKESDNDLPALEDLYRAIEEIRRASRSKNSA